MIASHAGHALLEQEMLPRWPVWPRPGDAEALLADVVYVQADFDRASDRRSLALRPFPAAVGGSSSD